MAISCPSPPPNTGFLTGVLGQVDCYTNTFVQDTYLSFFGNGTVFGHVLTGALVLTIAFYGISISFGRSNLSLGNLGPLGLKIGFIIAITATWGTFSLLIYDTMTQVPEAMGGGIIKVLSTTATDKTSVLGALDLFGWHMDRAFDKCMQNAGVLNPQKDTSMYIAALLIWVAKYAVIIFAFAFLLVSKISVAVLLGVGPFFIGMYLFTGTKGLFEGWLRTTLGFALVPLFILVSAALLMTLVDGYVTQLYTITQAGFPFLGIWTLIGTLLLVCLGFAVFFIQVPNIAASVGGGIAIHGVAAATGAAAFAAFRTAKLGARGAAGGAALGYAMRNPASRATLGSELRAAGRRKLAGLGESARFWNKTGTTASMRETRNTAIIKSANSGTRVTKASSMIAGPRSSAGPYYG